MRLMIIGTLDGQIGAASQIAIKRGAKVTQANDIESALTALRGGQSADLVMIDVKHNIGSLVQSLTTERINVVVVACGVGNDTQAAVNAIRAGAREYIPLPPNPELIAAVLTAVSEEDNTIISEDPAMLATLKLAQQVASSNANILVTGESGTGKELVARFLHAKSNRLNARFVAVNCAAIPENLLESELFGHEKGAFTGAIARRIGKFEEADKGTLLLDEISEMDQRLQAKLLRAIQEGEIDRLGGKKTVKVDVRIIATSNRNLETEVAEKRFREDLYFRLNVVNLQVPALRDRPLDIPILAEHFVEKYSKANGIEKRPFSEDAIKKIASHHWQGNVRELENTMHRCVLTTTGDEIGADEIVLSGQIPTPGSSENSSAEDLVTNLVGRTVAEVERELIIDTLLHCLGNRTHAANILGISIRTLRNKLRQYNEQGFNVPMPGISERPAL